MWNSCVRNTIFKIGKNQILNKNISSLVQRDVFQIYNNPNLKINCSHNVNLSSSCIGFLVDEKSCFRLPSLFFKFQSNTSVFLNSVSKRSYSKSKERGEKKKKGSVQVNENEIAQLINVEHLKNDLQKALDQLKNDYVKNVTIRSAAGSIESLQVEFEGETFTLQELATIQKKGSQLLVVNLSSFPQAIKNVLTAINDSGMGLNPQQDGTTIFLPIPKVTREYREQLAKNAKTIFQKFKDQNRDIQNRYTREVKKREKEVSADLSFSVQLQIQSMTEKVVGEGEKIMIAKQNELLGNKE